LGTLNQLPIGGHRWQVHFINALLNSSEPVDSNEVFVVCLVAVVNGFCLSAAINRKWLNRFAQKLGVTKKFGDADVWGLLMNSPTERLRYVRVRDHRHDLCYEGWINYFSDGLTSNELFLRDVIVFRNTDGSELYKTSGVYLTQEANDIAIEFYALDEAMNKPARKGENEHEQAVPAT
jgi:hypothetical protein